MLFCSDFFLQENMFIMLKFIYILNSLLNRTTHFRSFIRYRCSVTSLFIELMMVYENLPPTPCIDQLSTKPPAGEIVVLPLKVLREEVFFTTELCKFLC